MEIEIKAEKCEKDNLENKIKEFIELCKIEYEKEAKKIPIIKQFSELEMNYIYNSKKNTFTLFIPTVIDLIKELPLSSFFIKRIKKKMEKNLKEYLKHQGIDAKVEIIE